MTLSFTIPAHNEEACLGATRAHGATVLTSDRRFCDYPWWRVLNLMLLMRQTIPRAQARVQDRRNHALLVWTGASVTFTQRQTTR